MKPVFGITQEDEVSLDITDISIGLYPELDRLLHDVNMGKLHNSDWSLDSIQYAVGPVLNVVKFLESSSFQSYMSLDASLKDAQEEIQELVEQVDEYSRQLQDCEDEYCVLDNTHVEDIRSLELQDKHIAELEAENNALKQELQEFKDQYMFRITDE